MTRQETFIIVLKEHKFDRLLKNWFFAKNKEDLIKARETFCSVRACGGNGGTIERIKEQLATAQAKTFYTIHNTTTDEVTYHAIDEYTITLRDWMINHLDLSNEYIPYVGYKDIRN